ncbi:MAG: hypothetical protein PVG78_18395 [Desulfobacterales bacterium]
MRHAPGFGILTAMAAAAAMSIFQPAIAFSGSMEEFGRRVDQELTDIKNGIDRMSNEAEAAGENAGDEFRQAVDQARDDWEKTKGAFDRFRQSGEQGAKEMQKGLENAMEDLRQAYQDALDKVR